MSPSESPSESKAAAVLRRRQHWLHYVVALAAVVALVLDGTHFLTLSPDARGILIALATGATTLGGALQMGARRGE